jgi:hypothetical protein
MAKEVNIYYDKEGDYLEIIFKKEEGYFKETDNEFIMEKVDKSGQIIGISILNLSTLKNQAFNFINLKVG